MSQGLFPDCLAFFKRDGMELNSVGQSILTIMNFCLIRTTISTNVIMVERFGLKISNKGKGLYSVSGITAWFRYTKSTHLVFLIIFILIQQYRLYLILFSSLGFLYFLVIWLVGIRSCQRLDTKAGGQE
jgi:hypothetical protein